MWKSKVQKLCLSVIHLEKASPKNFPSCSFALTGCQFLKGKKLLHLASAVDKDLTLEHRGRAGLGVY